MSVSVLSEAEQSRDILGREIRGKSQREVKLWSAAVRIKASEYEAPAPATAQSFKSFPQILMKCLI